MGTVIAVNFIEKRKIEKYVVKQYNCNNCNRTVKYDSRKESNEPFLSFEGKSGQGLCKSCAVLVKGVVDEHEW